MAGVRGTLYGRWLPVAAVAAAAWMLAGVAAGAPSSVGTQLVVSADRAVWKPSGHPSKGVLTLRGVSPRMAVFAVAPRRESAVVPAGFLRTTWRKAIPKSKKKSTRGKRVTNAVLSFGSGADRQLVPVRLELVGSRADGSRFAFRVRPLKTKARAHTTDRLGLKRRTLQDVTLYVDPSITSAIRAMWAKLMEFFGGDQAVPPNPTSPGEGGTTDFSTGGVYAGEGGSFSTNPEWTAIEQANWDGAGGSYESDLGDPGAPRGGVSFADFTGASYDGLAVFSPATSTGFGDHISFSSTQVTDSAIYMVSTPELTIKQAEFNGLDMRGTSVSTVSINNSLFESVDMTGVRFGSADTRVERGSVKGSVFLDVTTSRSVTPDDNATDNAGGNAFGIGRMDFTEVAFQDVTLTDGGIGLSTFQACSFQSTDFSKTQIEGATDEQAAPGGMFSPTFDGSIFEDVKFDGAEITNVSFAGVDFSGGNVSLDGAILNNVDFTGATGLQFVDWTQVEVEGRVYGLAEFGTELGIGETPALLRSITFDGEIPAVDPSTGFDIQPGTAYLIDPASGVRLETGANGQLAPVDPQTGERLTDRFGDPLIWSSETGLTDPLGNPYEVDYATGAVEGEG